MTRRNELAIAEDSTSKRVRPPKYRVMAYDGSYAASGVLPSYSRGHRLHEYFHTKKAALARVEQYMRDFAPERSFPADRRPFVVVDCIRGYGNQRVAFYESGPTGWEVR